MCILCETLRRNATPSNLKVVFTCCGFLTGLILLATVMPTFRHHLAWFRVGGCVNSTASLVRFPSEFRTNLNRIARKSSK